MGPIRPLRRTQARVRSRDCVSGTANPACVPRRGTHGRARTCRPHGDFTAATPSRVPKSWAVCLPAPDGSWLWCSQSYAGLIGWRFPSRSPLAVEHLGHRLSAHEPLVADLHRPEPLRPLATVEHPHATSEGVRNLGEREHLRRTLARRRGAFPRSVSTRIPETDSEIRRVQPMLWPAHFACQNTPNGANHN